MIKKIILSCLFLPAFLLFLQAQNPALTGFNAAFGTGYQITPGLESGYRPSVSWQAGINIVKNYDLLRLNTEPGLYHIRRTKENSFSGNITGAYRASDRLLYLHLPVIFNFYLEPNENWYAGTGIFGSTRLYETSVYKGAYRENGGEEQIIDYRFRPRSMPFFDIGIPLAVGYNFNPAGFYQWTLEARYTQSLRPSKNGERFNSSFLVKLIYLKD